MLLFGHRTQKIVIKITSTGHFYETIEQCTGVSTRTETDIKPSCLGRMVYFTYFLALGIGT